MVPRVVHKWLHVGDLRVHCLAAGEAGSPIVLLHGGGIDSASLSWSPSIGPLAAGHRVFAPDFPGYGKSDKLRVAYSTPYFIDFVDAFLDALGLESASLVGLSMGGASALGLALSSPDRVERLVLVDSYGLGRDVPWRALSYMIVHMPVLNEFFWWLEARSEVFVKWSLRTSMCSPGTVTPELVKEVTAMMREPGTGRAFRVWQKSELEWRGLRTDFTPWLSELRVPTLILHGAKDTLVPPAWAGRAHDRIPGSELHILPGCGHWLPRERPAEMITLVSRFLDGPARLT